MGTKSESPQPGDLITKSAIKDEYGLTERQIGCLGAPDLKKRNPHFRTKGSPMKLYSRARVEQWLEQHPDEKVAADERTSARQMRDKAQQGHLRRRLEELLSSFEVRIIPDREDLVRRTIAFRRHRYGSSASHVSERDLCSHIRHRYTNYEELLKSVARSVNPDDYLALYPAIRMYVCCRIVRQCRLGIHPVEAAFGPEENIPKWVHDDDPEVAALQFLEVYFNS